MKSPMEKDKLLQIFLYYLQFQWQDGNGDRYCSHHNPQLGISIDSDLRQVFGNRLLVITKAVALVRVVVTIGAPSQQYWSLVKLLPSIATAQAALSVGG